ncbi:MAG: copper homeostasis protein CutC [Marinilabiliaceae bacterium]
MINRIHLEISVFSFEAAKKAEKAGADRIELCAGPSEGGTTPPFSLIKAVCHKVNIPVYPIIRPRGGDFFYSDEEFEMMKEDIRSCKAAGCSGIATSVLDAGGRVDAFRLRELVDLAAPLGVTFIRAFDLVPDPEKAIETIIQCGCERILTSGQAPKVIEALPFLQELQKQATGRISIMPGSGIRAENLKEVIEKTGVSEVHASARVLVPNDNPNIDILEFGQKVDCNIEEVRKMRKTADNPDH